MYRPHIFFSIRDTNNARRPAKHTPSNRPLKPPPKKKKKKKKKKKIKVNWREPHFISTSPMSTVFF